MYSWNLAKVLWWRGRGREDASGRLPDTLDTALNPSDPRRRTFDTPGRGYSVSRAELSL